MKYLCLFYPALPGAAPELEACREELRLGGHHAASASLRTVMAAVTIRVRDGLLAIADGPVTTGDTLGGYCEIDARDLNDAVRIASRLPAACVGAIEIHPVDATEPSDGGHLPWSESPPPASVTTSPVTLEIRGEVR